FICSTLIVTLFPYTTLFRSYIISKPRVGYFVEEIDSLPYRQSDISNNEIKKTAETTEYKIDFSSAKIDEEAFPFTIWRKYAKDVDRKSTRLNSSHVKISYAV